MSPQILKNESLLCRSLTSFSIESPCSMLNNTSLIALTFAASVCVDRPHISLLTEFAISCLKPATLGSKELALQAKSSRNALHLVSLS